MTSNEIAMAAADIAQEDDLFEMANLFPRTTGLPMTVWVSPRGSARHDVRIKVNMTHGNQMSPSNTAVVGVRPAPQVIAGDLSAADERAFFDWIALNAAAIIACWDGDIDAAQLVRALRPLASAP